mmetsp:Transcript_24093/g.55909  ORF Transcript_24093/g.55909 Transcript_24093/m.55909 type:complete len:188 (-) Transcript_24093:284-847(-)
MDEAGGIAGRWLAVPPGTSGVGTACGQAVSAGAGGEPKPIVDACQRGDEPVLDGLLDALPLSRLELLAAAVAAARDRKSRQLPRPTERRAPAKTPTDAACNASRGKAAHPRAAPAASRATPAHVSAQQAMPEDELDGAATIAGRWLDVPAGGTLPSAPHRVMCASAARPAVPASSSRRPERSGLSMD